MTTKKQCRAIASASGEQCKRKSLKDSDYCKQHYKQLHPVATEPDAASPVEVIEQAGSAASPHTVINANPEFAKYELAKRISQSLANSTLVPEAFRGRPNDVFVAVNMGAELGMEPFQAIQSIAVIEGKPCLYGDGLIGVVRASPKCLWIEESLSDDGTTATCRTQRKGDPNPTERSYCMSDAMLAGIDSKYNWKKHPKRMLQMRARAYCLRDAYPDLLKGLGVVEELQDHDNTPPPVSSYQLPEAPRQTGLSPDMPSVTLSEVEKAMHQASDMEQLLAASAMAKQLTNPADVSTARITYSKMRDTLIKQHGDSNE